MNRALGTDFLKSVDLQGYRLYESTGGSNFERMELDEVRKSADRFLPAKAGP